MCTENIQAKMSPAVTTNEDAYFCAYSQILVYMASCISRVYSARCVFNVNSNVSIQFDGNFVRYRLFYITKYQEKISCAALGIPNA